MTADAGPGRAARRGRARRRAGPRPPRGDERGLDRDGPRAGRGHRRSSPTTPRCGRWWCSSSHPKAFCVGADLKERNAFTDEDLRAQRPLAQAAYRGVLDLPVPAIAAVDGYALGGGFEIALSCDLVVCGEDAVVGLPEVSVGVIPGGGGTQLLTRRVGWSRAARMVFTAQRFPARGRCALGAVDEVVPAARRATGRSSWRPSIAGQLAGRRAQRQGRDAPGLRHRPGLRAADRGRALGRHGLLRRTAPRGSRRSTRNAVLSWPGR